MSNKIQKLGQCTFCNENANETYTLYKLVVTTNKAIYEIGMTNILEKLADWAMHKGLHLSASQIILLRPDILHDFLKYEKDKETVKGWHFKEYAICMNCYNLYREKVPAR